MPIEDARARELMGEGKAPRMWPPLLVAFSAILFGLGGIVGWAFYAKIDSAVVANGTLVVELNRRNLQHLEGGIVYRVLVREGDSVKSGQALIELDPTRLRSELNMIKDEMDRLQARGAVLLAEKNGLDAPEFPLSLEERINEPEIANLLSLNAAEFQARRSALEGQTSILSQRAKQLEIQVKGLEMRISSLDRQLELVRREMDNIDELVEKGLERIGRLLSLQREEAKLAGEKGEIIETIARTRQAIGETELQKAQLQKTRQEDVAKELREIQGRLKELGEREVSENDQLRRLSVVAPVDGTVMDLRFTTRGGVVAPGALIASIVPQQERLVVEARVSPAEVNTLRLGMQATVRLVHAAGSMTPTIEGEVERIAPDSVVNPDAGTIYFPIRVAISAQERVKQQELRLQSGMQVEVMIRRGERTAASYILRPILDRFSKSLREF